MAVLMIPAQGQRAVSAGSETAALFAVNLVHTWGWVLVALLGLIILVATITITCLDDQQVFRAALVGVAPWVPSIGTVGTVVAYLVLPDAFGDPKPTPMWVSDLAVFIGAASGIIAWLLLAGVYSPFTRARSANTGEYGEIRLRLEAVRDRLRLWSDGVGRPVAGEAPASEAPEGGSRRDVLPALLPGVLGTIVHRLSPFAAAWAPPAGAYLPAPAGPPPTCQGCPAGGSADGERCAIRRARIAEREVAIVRETVERALLDHDRDGEECRGLPWVLGTGYVEGWQLIHAAEEALIDLETVDIVVRDALHDESRICGCEMENGADLLARLRRAVCSLSPQAAMYLKEVPPGGTAAQGGDKEGADAPLAGLDPVCASFRQELLARSIVREVRHAINVYRDSRRAGLVRARARLIKTIIMTGLATYGLMALAVMRGAPEQAIVAGVSFYLVGAAVGLFNRLYQEAQADTAVDDFGLSTARLIHAPMFSGLAAVGGVVVTALLAVAFQGPAQAATHSISLPSLSAIFDLQQNQAGIVVAAIFGLTPNLLIQRLNTSADQYKNDLKNSQALTKSARTSA